MISADTKITKSTDFIEAPVDGDVVLMHTVSGKFFSLSDTGKRVWEVMDNKDTISNVVDKLLEEFEIDRENCEKDVIELCEDFSKRDLIKLG